ncbi:MAG: helicase-related protein, partial [Saprospiraceae bacterium]
MLLGLILEFSEWKNTEELADDEKEEQTRYFFLNYFSSKQYIEGYRFKKKLTTKDWFRFNCYYLTDIDGIGIKDNELSSFVSFDDKVKTEANRLDYINDRLIESLTVGGIKSQIDESYKKKTFFNCLFDGVLKKEFDEWVKLKWDSKDLDYLLDELNTLQEILRGVFRNGSGLLPCFIADSHEEEFEQIIVQVLKESFPEVLEEIRTIIIDFDKIVSVNFSDRSKIKYAMYNQSPVVPASGEHSKDVTGIATQFRMPGFPYVVITTDVLKEGEDLHTYCSDIYHYGIAWNPSDMEQRTGRIDRINSKSYFKLKEAQKITFDNS